MNKRNQESVGDEAASATTMQGLDGFTVQAARELRQHGILVHACETGEDVVNNVIALLEEK